MSAAQTKYLGDGVLILFRELAIVWRLITRLTGAFFVRQAAAEAADCIAGPSAVRAWGP
jgi:hypothetical protein